MATEQTCYNCENEIEGTPLTVGDNTICATCYNELGDSGDIFFCEDCEGNYWSAETSEYLISNEGIVCEECFGLGDYPTCGECEMVFSASDPRWINGEDGFCTGCIWERDEDQYSNRPFDKSSTKYQSKEVGEVIKSKRRFGVEIELLNKEVKEIGELSTEIDRSFGFEHDGSIRGEGQGIEVVTPIMSGRKGEEAIRDMFTKINKHNFTTNVTCGLHVHLDGKGFMNDQKILMGTVESPPIEKIEELDMESKLLFIVKRELADTLSRQGSIELSDVAGLLAEESRNSTRLFLSKTLNAPVPNVKITTSSWINKDMKVKSIVFSELTEKERIDEMENGQTAERVGVSNNDYVFLVDRNQNLTNTKTLLYLYTAYGDVFLAMLPKSRRQHNAFCQRLSMSFAPNQIEMIDTYSELEALWYKTKSLMDTATRKGRKYDDSRYYGINLHSLFAKYGTIEIRMHAATLDPDKAIYWIALHQDILDKISCGDIRIKNLKDGTNFFEIKDRADYLINTLQLREPIRKYMEQRIKYFNQK